MGDKLGLLGEAVLWVIGIAVTVFGYLFLVRDIMVLEMPAYTLVALGNILFLLVFLRVFARQKKDFNRKLDEINVKAKEDFYSLSTEARIDRAHRIFYHLFRQGEMYRSGTPQLRQEWDRDVQHALRDHCNDAAIDIYLSNTGRINPGSQMHPPADEYYDTAMKFINRLLEKDFENEFRR